MTRAISLIPLVVITSLGGCGGGDGAPDADRREPNPVESVRHGDTVTIALRADREDLTIGEPLSVVVEVTADANVAVTFDEYEPKLGEHPFEYRAWRATHEPPTRMPDGRLRWTRTYEVDFFAPGDYELPGASVRYEPASDPGADADETAALSLETDPIAVHVRLADAASASAEELSRVPTPDPLNLAPTPWAWLRGSWGWIAAGVMLVVGAAVLALWLRRRRRATPAVPVPAHEWALSRLAALLAEDLLSQGRAQEFYYRLCDVVRGYVERRHGVSAPEMTTEEFLATMADDRRFRETHRVLLQRFMTACDEVKYARHEPTTTESDTAVHAAREYIDETREHQTAHQSDRAESGRARERAA
jgi:hypothetical protein